MVPGRRSRLSTASDRDRSARYRRRLKSRNADGYFSLLILTSSFLRSSFLIETRLLPAFISPTLVVTAVCLSSCKQAQRENGSWSRPTPTNARRSEEDTSALQS